MKFYRITLFILLCIYTCTGYGQNVDQTGVKYDQHKVFNPLFYPEKGNEFRNAGGAPGSKYWQNRANYQLNVKLDTVSKTISGTEIIDYTNNSPDALQYLWLQMDQNIYKKDARSNFVTGFAPGPDQHTNGYQIESVAIEEAGVVKPVKFIITDTRMQIRLPKDVLPNKGKIRLKIKMATYLPSTI